MTVGKGNCNLTLSVHQRRGELNSAPKTAGNTVFVVKLDRIESLLDGIFRMSKRSDIIDGKYAATSRDGLIYTEVLGWVDLWHSRGEDIRDLLRLIVEGESSGKEFYDVRYAQGMTAPFRFIRSGKMMTWRIRRGRPHWEQKSIALAMMMTMAVNAKIYDRFSPFLMSAICLLLLSMVRKLNRPFLSFLTMSGGNEDQHVVRPIAR